MNALFSKRHRPKRLLVVDIGGSSVGGALIEISKNERPSILYHMRARIPIPDKKGINELGHAALTSLEEVVKEIHEKGYKPNHWDSVDDVHVYLAAPWCFPSISTVHKSGEKPMVVTKKEIRDIIDDLRKKGEAEHEGTHIIESEVLDVRLNGYSVDNPFGKEANAYTIDVFSSRVRGDTTENIERKISARFSTENIHFHSSTLALYTTVRGVFTDGESHLIMDISGDMTEVLLVRDEVLVEVGSIPIGTHDIPRSVAETYKTTAEEALSRVQIARDGKSASEDIKMNAAAEKLLTKWKESLITLLDQFEHSTGIPHKIFYTVDVDMRPLFEELLIDKNLFGRDDVMFLESKTLSPFIEYRAKMNQDFFLMLEAIYTHMHTVGLEE